MSPALYDVLVSPSGPDLLAAMFNAPLIAASPRAKNRVLHAVDMEQIVASWWTRTTVDAVCGAKRLKMWEGGLFPPRIASLPKDMTRCKECQRLTGNKRPRCAFAVREDERG